MNILVLVAHPNMSQSRVNKTWAERIRQEPRVTVRELYAAYPDFKIDVEKEQRLLEAHDRVVFQFPFYWYSTPALLKQWQDDVLTYGWAFGPGGTRLRDKELMLAISAGSSEDAYRWDGYNRFTIGELTAPLQAVANLTGMRFLAPFTFCNAAAASEEQIRASAEAYVKHVRSPSAADVTWK